MSAISSELSLVDPWAPNPASLANAQTADAPPAVRGMPRISIEVDGLAVDVSDVISIHVRGVLSAPTVCEVAIVESRIGAEPLSPPRPGATLVVTLNDTAVFEGEITAIDFIVDHANLPSVRLRAYDPLHRLRKRQSVRTFEAQTTAELVGALTTATGLSVEAPADNNLLERIIQTSQSDLELLTEICERSGLYFIVRGQVLHLLTLEGDGEVPVELKVGRTLLEAQARINSEPACRNVTTNAWDPARVQMRTGYVSAPRVGRDVEADASPDVFGVDGSWTLLDKTVRDDRQAEALAQAELDRQVACEVTLSGVALGDSRLRPGSAIDVDGLAASVNGKYVLSEVVHTVDLAHGWLSQISTKPPPARPSRSLPTAVWGVVIRVDDPEGLGRVRVSLPAYGDVESDWLGVVTPGAGAGKGMVSLPDVNDHVLVLTTGPDVAHGMVLGGLYGPDGPPEGGGVEGNAIKRHSVSTPGGQRLLLDDTRRSVRVEAKDGSFLEMTPEGMTLHAASNFTIEAPGHKLRIRASAIGFEKA